MLRTAATSLVFVAHLALAQTPPPIVPADQAPQQPYQLPPVQQQARSCASTAECDPGDVCMGFREIAPGQWSRGTCTMGAAKRARMDQGSGRSLACRTDEDCYRGEFCGGHQPLGNGAFGPGTCQLGDSSGDRYVAPPARGPTRFAYTGTVPSGYRLVEEPNLGLLITGIAVAGASYFTAVLWALGGSSGFPLIPFVGPFIEAGRFGFVSGAFTLALVTTVGEVVGATLITIGLLKPKQWLEKSAPSVSVLPLAPGGQPGASVIGRF